MLYWNVELYRKLGHMVWTTGSRMKGNGTVFPVYPCLTRCELGSCTAPSEHAYHEVWQNEGSIFLNTCPAGISSCCVSFLPSVINSITLWLW